VDGLVLLAFCLRLPCVAELRLERFDKDPGWDGYNNRTSKTGPREVKHDFAEKLLETLLGRMVGGVQSDGFAKVADGFGPAALLRVDQIRLKWASA
jgi:hypothetical protein